MGNEIFVYLLTTDDQSFIARVDPRADLRPGDKVQMSFNAEKVQLFDTTSEKNIATPADE